MISFTSSVLQSLAKSGNDRKVVVQMLQTGKKILFFKLIIKGGITSIFASCLFEKSTKRLG